MLPADDPQQLANQRSLALHQLIRDRLADHPQWIALAEARLAKWATILHPVYAQQWHALLTGPRHALLPVLTNSSESAIALRHVSPFAGIISPRERWEIWQRVKDHA